MTAAAARGPGDRPMRVLLAHAYLAANGGAETVARAFETALRARGVAVGVVDVAGHVTPEGKHSPLPLAGLVPRRMGLVNWAVTCRHVPALARDYDAVLYMFGEGPRLDRPTLVFRHAPVVFAQSRPLVEALAGQSGAPFAIRKLYGRLGAAIARLGRPDPDAFTVANSRWTAGHVETGTGITVDRILYPAIDLDPATAAPMTGEGASARTPDRLVMLGRIVPNKRIHEVIALVAGLQAKRPGLRLDVIGRASRKYARDLIARHAGDAVVRFHPDADDAARGAILAATPVGVHAYRAEHFGIAVAEMIHAGVLPLVYDNGGVCELVPFPDQRFDDDASLWARIEAWLSADGAVRARRIESLRQAPAYLAACEFADRLEGILGEFLAYCDRWHAAGPAAAKRALSAVPAAPTAPAVLPASAPAPAPAHKE
ncbi:glycosyltransferase family 4 protein [Roseisalinus antarcticus]|uniref:Glycosyl transferases group 1 n=1 Tax=Roseisalinus antarcticus TaxID=254357 RepID=A0A1Y5TPZ8_9RHOB|nr:glycosyltransferase family 4 protein [Roseisalinus antarcticus]SLN69226.1 Glycosyl transferases group 1 [Roseisalinus antarcticus]